MDKYKQIELLANAADLLYRVLPGIDPDYTAKLITIADSIADLADEIEAA